MDEKELASFIEANSDRIKEAAIEACIDKIKDNVRYGLPDSVQKVVNDFMKDDVAPAVAKALQDQKGPIIKAAISGASEIGDALSKMMVEKAVANLTGYTGRDVLTKLLT